MTHDTTLAPPAENDPSARSIPSFRDISREALGLYRRNFWTYFSITMLAAVLQLLSQCHLMPLYERWWMQDFAATAFTAVTLLFCGIAVLILAAAALVDTGAGGATVPESFLLVLPRLPRFLVMWAAASCIVGFPFRLILPGALLYVGFSMIEIVFLAEALGPFSAVLRSWRLAWKPTVRLRIVQLTAAALAAWVASSALPVCVWYIVALRLAPVPLTHPFAISVIFGLLALLCLFAALVLPALILAKVILYRHAALLYPPRQRGAVTIEPEDTPFEASAPDTDNELRRSAAE